MRPLAQAGCNRLPFVCRQQQWNHVQFPRTVHSLRITIYIVRDAVVSDDSAAVIPPRRQFVATQFFQPGKECFPMRPKNTGFGTTFVVSVGGRAVPEETLRVSAGLFR